MSAVQILTAYRVSFCALIVAASAQTLVTASSHHIVALAVVEIAGALLLAWRRTHWVGAALLLAVFACAQVISAIEGNYPTRFLQFAASTVLIVLLDRTLSRAARTAGAGA
jgi:ABC-type uncharacterized transport system permease subunit